jgi:hypothetical protein
VIIPVVGPSKAGKTESVRALQRLGLVRGFAYLDLDCALGEDHRSNVDPAITIVEKCQPGTVLVDVGSGQFMEPRFRSYLERLPGWAAKLAATVRGILGMPDLTRPADQT